jgi:hypothetical protein
MGEGSSERQQQQQQLEQEQPAALAAGDDAYCSVDELGDAADDAEDISSSDEEYNHKNFGIFQALPVEGEPDWSLGMCSNFCFCFVQTLTTCTKQLPLTL